VLTLPVGLLAIAVHVILRRLHHDAPCRGREPRGLTAQPSPPPRRPRSRSVFGIGRGRGQIVAGAPQPCLRKLSKQSTRRVTGRSVIRRVKPPLLASAACIVQCCCKLSARHSVSCRISKPMVSPSRPAPPRWLGTQQPAGSHVRPESCPSPAPPAWETSEWRASASPGTAGHVASAFGQAAEQLALGMAVSLFSVGTRTRPVHAQLVERSRPCQSRPAQLRVVLANRMRIQTCSTSASKYIALDVDQSTGSPRRSSRTWSGPSCVDQRQGRTRFDRLGHE